MKFILLYFLSLILVTEVYSQNINGVYSNDISSFENIQLYIFKDTAQLYINKTTAFGKYKKKNLIQGLIERISDSTYVFKQNNSIGFKLNFINDCKSVLLTEIAERICDSFKISSSKRFYRIEELTDDNKISWEIATSTFVKPTGEPGKYTYLKYELSSNQNLLKKCDYLLSEKDGLEVDYFTEKEVDSLGIDKYAYFYLENKGKCRGRWKNDLKKGKWKYYNIYEQCVRKEFYRKGKLVKTKSCNPKQLVMPQ